MLSLIIPTYNCIDSLDETLGSVTSQLPDDYELVIVDDGSTDGTAGRLAEYREELKNVSKDNIKIILNEHKGVSGARNAGIWAAGKEFVTFMDCDDCLADDFFKKSRPVMEVPADLYVFSFEVVKLHPVMGSELEDGGKAYIEDSVSPSALADKIYESNSEYADEYIRNRHLLVYSACNKFYRKELLDRHHIRFKDGLEFGEDRLFNYDYIPVAGRIISSSVCMFRYMQRNTESASNRIFPDYYNTIMMLHKAKMDCFLNISENTSLVEKRDFISYDLAKEMRRMLDHFGERNKRIHMIGIGGSSMWGMALMLKEKGFNVSGSDRTENANVKRLRNLGINVIAGHSVDNIHGADLVVYSAAVMEDNVELSECSRLGIPALERSVVLGLISEGYKDSVAVCGTHGKTTVTSMLAQILVAADMDPTVHIGGVLDAIGGSIRHGHSDIFITEACEYKRSFLNICATGAVVLNIDEDHLDYYSDIDDIEEAFGEFLRTLPSEGWVLVNGNDERAVRQLAKLPCRTFLFGISNGESGSSQRELRSRYNKESACKSPELDYEMADIIEDEKGCISFDMCYRVKQAGSVKQIDNVKRIERVNMKIPGLFNAMNALAALGAAHILGACMDKAIAAAEEFTGARRRFEKTGVINGAEVFHDYGHNPAEIRNALSVARKRCPGGKLWAVIQPHTYSRLKASFDEFVTCAGWADKVLVTDVFAARESDPGDIHSGMLVEAMKDTGVDAVFTPGFEDAEREIIKGAAEGDLVITLGCGDINRLNKNLIKSRG